MTRKEVEKEARKYAKKTLCIAEVSELVDFALCMVERQREEDIETAMDHTCMIWAERCNCRGEIAADIRRQKEASHEEG